MNYLILFCLFFSLFFISTQCQYEFMKLALQWPSTTCSTPKYGTVPCITPIPNVFTIHGLWPANYSKSQPENCSQTQFQIGQVSSSCPI